MKISIFASMFYCFAIAVASASETTSKDAKELKIHLMETTKINAIMGLSTTVDKFVSDGDPNTLEVIFLEKTEDGPSHVSDDGEAIFLNQASDEEQQRLIEEAFDIRLKRLLSKN